MTQTGDPVPENNSVSSEKADIRKVGEYVALLAIVIPAVGYAIAYQFRLGQLHYMGLPVELLSLSLGDIVTGVLAALVATMIMFAVNWFFATMVAGESVPELERSLVRILVPVGILTVLFSFADQLTIPGAVGLVIVVVLMLAGEFIPPLVTQKGVVGLEAKLRQYRKSAVDVRPTRVGRLFGGNRALLAIVSIAYMALFVASPMGAMSVRTRTTYAVIRSQPERVVVSEYNGSLVTLNFDREQHMATSPVLVFRPEDLTTGMYVERLGTVRFDSQ